MKSTLTINQVPPPEDCRNLTDDQLGVLLASIALMAQIGVTDPYIISTRMGLLLDRLTDLKPEHVAAFRKVLNGGCNVSDIVAHYAEIAVQHMDPRIIEDIQREEALMSTAMNSVSTVN